MIKGEVHLVFKDVKTGEITKEVRENNIVPDEALRIMANATTQTGSSDFGRFSNWIVIGASAQEVDRSSLFVFDIHDIGVRESGVNQPRLQSGNVGSGSTFAYYYEYQQRFAAPTATRTITTIGLQFENEAHSALAYQKPARCMAYLSLSTPCLQSPTETLDIFYRVIFNNPNPAVSGMSTEQMEVIAQRHMNDDGESVGSIDRREYPVSVIEYMYQGNKMSPNINGRPIAAGSLGFSNTGTSYGYTDQCIRELTHSITIADSLGRIFGSISHQDDYSPHVGLFHNSVLRDLTENSPVQNIFPHSTAATGPFYQSSGVATGAGTVSIDGSGWTNPDFNKLLQVEITQSGILGTSEYRINAMRTTGFIQNTYRHAEVSLPNMNGWNDFDGGSIFKSGSGSGSWIEDRGPHMMPQGTHMTKTIVFAPDWIGKYDLMSCEQIRFHSGSTPAFNGTSINQIVTVPGANNGALVSDDIWVADETGLYRIFEDNSTVQHFDNTHTDLTGLTSAACYGVTFTPGRIWAAFDGGLVYTDDNGASFTLYNGASSPTFTVVDFSRIWFIQGNPTAVGHEIGIAYNDQASHLTAGRCDLQLNWWDPTSGFGNTITQLHNTSSTSPRNPWQRIDIFRVFECAPDGSVWACSHHEANSNNPAMFAYNSTAASQTFTNYSNASVGQRYNFGWTTDLLGNYAINIAWWDATNAYFAICQQDGSATRSDVCNVSELPVNSSYNWYNGSCDEGFKCITPSGMLVYSTIDNFVSSAHLFWGMRPAWQSADPFGGAGKYILFDEYGWDGANWVKDHAGNKPTHASSDTLIDGLTISFDDNAGADTFVATDYYTVGIIDGILADGATEFEHKYGLYYKKALFNQTDIETGVFPAVPATTGVYRTYSGAEKDVLVDNANVTSTDGFLAGSGSPWYARINQVLVDEALVSFRLDTTSDINEVTFGFADTAKIGATPVSSLIDYAIRITPGALGGSNGFRVEAYTNGVVAAVIDDGSQGFQTNDLYNPNNGYGSFNRLNEDFIPMKLHREAGSTDVKVYYRNELVHTFTGATTNLVVSTYSTSSSNDVRVDVLGSTLVDNLIGLGNPGSNTGVYHPDFYEIDTSDYGRMRPGNILINGAAPATVLYDDYTTTLGNAEISILKEGFIRYSALQIGETISIGPYNVLLNE